MAMTRKQTADRIKDVRYAVKSGACTVAHSMLQDVIHYKAPGTRDRTIVALARLVVRCKRAPHFNPPKRRKR